MAKLLKSRKAQAATEIAIIGSLMILAFSYLILFTFKVNMRQELLQGLYTNLLKQARAQKNDGVVVIVNGKARSGLVYERGIPAYTRGPNILEPYSPGQFMATDPAGRVFWSHGKWKTDDQSSPAKIKVRKTWNAILVRDEQTYEKHFERSGSKPRTQWTVTYAEIDETGGAEITRTGPNN